MFLRCPLFSLVSVFISPFYDLLSFSTPLSFFFFGFPFFCVFLLLFFYYLSLCFLSDPIIFFFFFFFSVPLFCLFCLPRLFVCVHFLFVFRGTLLD
ncbi:hypothetical protein TCDM_05780 [Trypanosoma cruzi Dm28c]|uniref:Uncharacterized protein n=1 Tax=Trypanosoma cruzi Dm28c TaxID=1416333 RepID=V5BDB5_TRYCR|nr:hypothetical protein TCDM_05780 [Trypanosoma cruzi Dm28c]